MTYLTLEDINNTYIGDIEANSLNPSEIWCGIFINKGTRQVHRFINDGSASIYHELRRFFLDRLNATFIGHNFISYDIYHLSRLCGFEAPYNNVIDTLVLSYLYNPALEYGHSLEAYGERLKYPKGDYSDWSRYTPEMLEYCERDVELTEKVYDALSSRMKKVGFSELSCEIEHKIRQTVDEQERHGFWFNQVGARDLHRFLRQRESDLAIPIQKLFPPKLEEVGRYKRRKRKDGSDFASYERHSRDYPNLRENEDGTYSTLEYREFNIGSPKQRLERLLEVGYQPTSRTKKGNPKVDEDSLLVFAKECGRQEVTAMADWLVHNGRANMIETWLGALYPDSRIHGRVFTCGATTRRMTHNNPNTANIPSSHKAKYGKECRSLWGVEPSKGLKLVGCDASGLENIGLLHYLNNHKATEVLNRPKPNDVHTANARSLSEALGRPVDREWGSKTTWYAWLYGAYPPKLGEIVKGTPKDGQIVIDTFFKNVPGLKGLIEEVQAEWINNNGLLRCIDGGFVRCPSMNAALNYRIQSMGAIVMKLAAIRLKQNSYKAGIDFKFVGNIHDEFQKEVKDEDAEELGKLAVRSIEESAEFLNFRLPLTGEYKVGDNWSQTH